MSVTGTMNSTPPITYVKLYLTPAMWLVSLLSALDHLAVNALSVLRIISNMEI